MEKLFSVDTSKGGEIMKDHQLLEAVEIIEKEAKAALKNPLLPTSAKKTAVLMSAVVSELVKRGIAENGRQQ